MPVTRFIPEHPYSIYPYEHFASLVNFLPAEVLHLILPEKRGQHSQEDLRVSVGGNVAINLRNKIPSSPKAMGTFR
jgi:hypothetical protein